jgi:hypothetical protein
MTPTVLSGSVVRGMAIAEVVATGIRNEIGKIGQSLATLETEPPRLQAQTRRVVDLRHHGRGQHPGGGAVRHHARRMAGCGAVSRWHVDAPGGISVAGRVHGDGRRIAGEC